MRVRCLRCGSFRTIRRRRRGIGYLLAALLLIRPFRCEKCQARFMRFVLPGE